MRLTAIALALCLFAGSALADDSWSLFREPDFEATFPHSPVGQDDDVKTAAGTYRQRIFMDAPSGGRVFAVNVYDYAPGSLKWNETDGKLETLLKAYGAGSSSRLTGERPVARGGDHWLEGDFVVADGDAMTVRITAVRDKVIMAIYARHGADQDMTDGRRFLDSVKVREPKRPRDIPNCGAKC